MLLRIGSEVLHSVMGGLSLFCLFYSAQMSDFNAAWDLFIEALKWGVLASIILHCKSRYLDA
jgi:hypothetical protein